MRRAICISLVLISCIVSGFSGARADDSGPPAAYDKWTAGKTSQSGLFNVWRDGGKIYLDIATSQLGQDFIEQAIPETGLGGWDITPGNPYFDFARVIRFQRADDKIAISWPNTSFVAPDGTPEQRAVQQTFAPSVVALAPIVAQDATSGRIVFDASALLGDVSDFTDGINLSMGITDPQAQYRLDGDRTYFGPAKAFPDNVLIEADQTFTSSQPPPSVDNVPDPRSLQLKLGYNFIKAPADGYMPRVADERVGFYPNIQLQFGNDAVQERQTRYILRWNFAPANPGKPSAATHPMILYLSNTIPTRYHDTVRDALLQWNKAFAKAGILDAVQVRDQPDDPSWDADDIRYNVVRWLTESNSGGFAQAGSVWDPRTGQLIHVGIVLDSDLMTGAFIDWRDKANPSAFLAKASSGRVDAEYGELSRLQAGYGAVALQSMGMLDTPVQRNAYMLAYLRSIVLHESGHEMGLEHNFIGSEAYTARDLQSKAFTSKYGIASSVMEYAPTNVWPKGTPQGEYFQSTLGPYDYYAIHWGYAAIPGARTPEDEVPTLKRWASDWNDPTHSFAMDEDVQYVNAHAIDPRVSWYDLTNDDLAWTRTQMEMSDRLADTIAQRYPASGQAYDPARTAFTLLFYHKATSLGILEHYIGGEYVDRSHAGDASFSGTPLSAVPRAKQVQAWSLLDRYMFSDAAWNYPPSLLRHLVYTEWVTDFPQPAWAYSPSSRHDMPIADMVGGLQTQFLQTAFQPLMLSRLDDLTTKYPAGSTMSLADLFDWMQQSAFGDLNNAHLAVVSELRRNLQQSYARLLAQMVLHPAQGTPYDAQSLARSELKSLQHSVHVAMGSPRLDTMTRAHLDSLDELATQTLAARPVITLDP